MHSFRCALATLWFRLTSLAIIGLVFAESLEVAAGKAQGWSFYISPSEVVFEVAVRLVFAALLGIALGTACSAALVPAIWYFETASARISEWSTRAAVVAVVFLDSGVALSVLIKWSYQFSNHRGVFDTLLRSAFYLVFALALCLPRSRRAVVTSLDGFLAPKMTRRIVTAMVGTAVALMILEFALAKRATSVKASSVSARSKSNLVLITFDALSAEDMSVYGYKLPTTPNIDAFADRATVFTNFYSASTFTTPCVATMLTGMYPSQTHVYQLQGRLNDPERSLPHLLRAAGYATASFFSNPHAYYLAASFGTEYDVLPRPIFQEGAVQHLWDATAPLHQNSGLGSRLEEYRDLAKMWNFLDQGPENLHERFRAATSFEYAREMIADLPDGFFLWVHVMTPHGPYLPDPEERGRFLPASFQEVFEGKDQPKWKPHYESREQSKVDEYRLRYDEFILTADRAFGDFISNMEGRGKLQNTTVIVSADHGESFEGGIFQHGNPEQTRPVIHIPLIIKTPGQKQGREVAVTADQTALAPTILELAGLPKPTWMDGQSLASWLTGDHHNNGKELAFTQYGEKNSVFKPLQHGTVGVIEGQYQYVLDLDAKKGVLRPLKEAQTWDIDRTAENPAKAAELLAAIYARFPELRRESK